MHDFYVQMSVPQAAKLLDAEPTFVYKLIRDGKILPAQKEPMKLTMSSLTAYVAKRIPSGFKIVPAT